MKRIFLFVAMFSLFSCSHNAKDYADRKPVLDYKKLFTGKLKAYAVVFDFWGKQTNTFIIESDGILSKDGKRIDMKQKFTYADGDVEEGTAYALFDETYPQHFIYKDHMMVDAAKYDQYGNTANVKYDLNVKRKGKSDIVVSCDDWLYLVNQNYAINTIHMSKFGINVAKVVMTLVKE